MERPKQLLKYLTVNPAPGTNEHEDIVNLAVGGPTPQPPFSNNVYVSESIDYLGRGI